MDNGGKNEAFFTGLLNKTRKDKIFIVILAGILMMVIAMPTKSSSAKSYTTGPVISTGSEDYEKNLGEELQQMLENTDGVGKVKVIFAGHYRTHNLSDDNQGRITCIVIYIL